MCISRWGLCRTRSGMCVLQLESGFVCRLKCMQLSVEFLALTRYLPESIIQPCVSIIQHTFCLILLVVEHVGLWALLLALYSWLCGAYSKLFAGADYFMYVLPLRCKEWLLPPITALCCLSQTTHMVCPPPNRECEMFLQSEGVCDVNRADWNIIPSAWLDSPSLCERESFGGGCPWRQQAVTLVEVHGELRRPRFLLSDRKTNSSTALSSQRAYPMDFLWLKTIQMPRHTWSY